MKITDIRKLVNQALAGELLTYGEMRPHLDFTIDEINTTLDSCFPVFSDLESENDVYDYFPDKFIRTVVVPGAAWHFYVNDEEGASTAQQYQLDFEKGKYIMLRDYIDKVPEEYQADNNAYVPDNPANMTFADGGLTLYGTDFFV